jgi:NADH:ubiquinone reductase (H+-translocating)
MTIPHILIIGCGFGGLEAAKALKNADVRVTILDRTNHHLFQPLLYQVATAGLSAPSIAAPIRHIFAKQRNATVLLKEVTRIDAISKTVHTSDGSELAYDALIVAAGATHSYFGNDGWAQHALGLKTLDDAFAIRHKMLMAFERAERDAAAGRPAADLNFIVIGAGPTGVEMAGTMAEIAQHTLKAQFRHIDPARSQVWLIEGGTRVLGAFSEALSAKALEQLQGLGVKAKLGARVVHVDADTVRVQTAEVTEAMTSACTVWAAGVKASPLAAMLAEAAGAQPDRAGRVAVAEDLRVPGLDKVFALGDMAAITSNGKPVPGVSPGAKQAGRRAAKNALALLNAKATEPFKYIDYGSLATIGRKAAITQVGPIEFSGFAAWLFWLFVHVYFLIGFRNRFIVLMEWAWAYLSFNRSARIVVNAEVEHARR